MLNERVIFSGYEQHQTKFFNKQNTKQTKVKKKIFKFYRLSKAFLNNIRMMLQRALFPSKTSSIDLS